MSKCPYTFPANAAFIVRAVNSHQLLTDTLRAADRFIDVDESYAATVLRKLIHDALQAAEA